MPFRKIHDSFWTDPELEEWTPDEKFFYLYCITNPQQTSCGCMSFSIKRVGFDLGYSKETVESLVKRMLERSRIMFDDETKELYVGHFYRYNKSHTPNHISHLEKDLTKIKSNTIREQAIADINDNGTDLPELKANTPPTPRKKPNIDFERVWKAYQRGGSKKEALLHWNKMTDEQRLAAAKGIPAYLNLTPDPTYRLHFIRYLKREMWVLDEFQQKDLNKQTITPSDQSTKFKEEVNTKELFG